MSTPPECEYFTLAEYFPGQYPACRSSGYTLIKHGIVESSKVGKRRIVTKDQHKRNMKKVNDGDIEIPKAAS